MSRTRHCQRCKAKIPAERIEALPETRLCMQCSKEVGGDFEVTATQESIGKTSSLKKNYGGVLISKKRRDIKPKQED